MTEPRSLARATLGALGVVYGDIGTSPLYALKEATAAAGGGSDPAAVLGVLSLIFWSLFIVVTMKYVVLILRADNAGEGGILSLLALVQQKIGTAGRLGRAVAGVGGARYGAVLLRRADHARDLGPERGRGTRGARPRVRHQRDARHPGHHRGAVRAPAARHCARRRAVRADHGSLVRRRSPCSAC